MVDALPLSVAVVLLGVTLTLAVLRPGGLPEAAGAVPAALAAVLLGLVTTAQAGAELRSLGPTVAFLAAVLVLAWLGERDQLFAAVGDRIASASRSRPVALLGLVFVTCSVVTAALSLDTTVVLLTPVVLATVRTVRLPARPHLYACVHLSNSASLLLPVSNLTNLLAFAGSGVSFLRFGALMTGPWLAAIAVEWVVLRRFFRRDLRGRGAVAGPARPLPAYTVVVVLLTLAGFGVTSLLGLAPWVAAASGALALAVPALARRRVRPREVLAAANPSFLLFVLGLAVTVRAVQVQGLDRLGRLLPHGTSLGALLVVAGVAAVLSNLINNLPAVLVLLPAVAGVPGLVLAVVIGVNVGPNLTYPGSLATLLWRRILLERGERPGLWEFTAVGLLSVPAALLASTGALWLSLRALGT